MAEAHLAARYNRPGFEIINHYTYAIVGDGDVWLFIVDRTVTPDAPTTDVPRITQTGKITTASWTSGAYTYLLATESPTVPIHRYF